MTVQKPDQPSLWPLFIVVGGAIGLGVADRVRHPRSGTPQEAMAAGTAAPAAATAVSAPSGAVPSSTAPGDVLAAGAPPASVVCPPHQLPDDGVCVPVPPPEDTGTAQPPLELLPGRPADYARYVTPVAARRAAAAPEGLGLFVAAPRGAPVTAINLEAQTGPTRRWVTTGPTARLLTLHRVERSGSTRVYVLGYDGLAFDMSPGAGSPGISDVAVGTPLGRVSPAASAQGAATGLTLTVRQLRRGVEPENVSPDRLLLDSSSIACDARNVLPLQPAP
jgi:hypothetical protein